MSVLFILFVFVTAIWTVGSAINISLAKSRYDVNPADEAKIALVGYAWIFGIMLVLSILILLGKAGGVIFVASLVAALVAFIFKLIKIARS